MKSEIQQTHVHRRGEQLKSKYNNNNNNNNNKDIQEKINSQMLNVWPIYLHLGSFGGKCR